MTSRRSKRRTRPVAPPRWRAGPVSRIGFGAMQLPGPGVFGPPRDRDAAVAVLRRAVELGVNHIDTAAVLRPGRGQRADPRRPAPLPRRPGAGEQGRGRPRRRGRLVARASGPTSCEPAWRTTCAAWRSTSSTWSTCVFHDAGHEEATGSRGGRPRQPAGRDDRPAHRGQDPRRRVSNVSLDQLRQSPAGRAGLRAERLQRDRPLRRTAPRPLSGATTWPGCPTSRSAPPSRACPRCRSIPTWWPRPPDWRPPPRRSAWPGSWPTRRRSC